MKIKKYLTISNLLYMGTLLFALGVILKTFLESSQLPPGACPVDNNRPLLYLSIILLIGVNLGTYGYEYWKKKKTE